MMRYKTKTEELEKAIHEKTVKVKELQLEALESQHRLHDLNFFKEELANKEHNIKLLEETIITLNRDNEHLK